eukprot:14838897-Ditylum_brightwellii.AAC.1
MRLYPSPEPPSQPTAKPSVPHCGKRKVTKCPPFLGHKGRRPDRGMEVAEHGITVPTADQLDDVCGHVAQEEGHSATSTQGLG